MDEFERSEIEKTCNNQEMIAILVNEVATEIGFSINQGTEDGYDLSLIVERCCNEGLITPYEKRTIEIEVQELQKYHSH